MKKTWIVAMAVTTGLSGQTLSEGPQSFQFAVASDEARPVFTYSTLGGPVVTGRPYSATEERHSTQTLGDGTHIETSETNRLFRDERGRTRVERKDGTISIYDPVEGFRAELNPATKTATKLTVMVKALRAPQIDTGDREKLEGIESPSPEKGTIHSGEEPQLRSPHKVQIRRGQIIGTLPPPGDVTFQRVAEPGRAMLTVMTPDGPGGVGGIATYTAAPAQGPTILRVNPGNNGSVENLAPQMVNGILAEGTRTTETIPAGKIGNDRPINIVNERWYSDALQSLIRSSSSDPRFGTTTYELLNVVQNAPDPSLFQIPADYTVQK
jgi:hypothetical protein